MPLLVHPGKSCLPIFPAESPPGCTLEVYVPWSGSSEQSGRGSNHQQVALLPHIGSPTCPAAQTQIWTLTCRWHVDGWSYVSFTLSHQYCPQPHSSQATQYSLTHLPLDKMAAISQTIFSNAFSWMKTSEFQIMFHWNVFLMVKLTICHHGFR